MPIALLYKLAVILGYVLLSPNIAVWSLIKLAVIICLNCKISDAKYRD